MVKLAPVPAATALHEQFRKIWTSGHVLSEWKEGIITSLYNGKEAKTDCRSYRPISLLSVPEKVFTHVLLARINPLLKNHCRPQQSGFTAGRSTTDAILALRLLSELHREFDRPLYVVYVDLKSAFDSLDRQALWRRPPGRPRKTSKNLDIQQIGNGTPASWRQMWQSADERGHRGESPQRTSVVYAS